MREGKGRAGYGDRYVDLRVEDHRTPIVELRRLLNMNYSYGYVLRSHALIDEGGAEDALGLAMRAVELSPENDVAHMALCRARFEIGDKQGAVEAFRDAERLNEKTVSYVRRITRWSFIAEDDNFFKDIL